MKLTNVLIGLLAITSGAQASLEFFENVDKDQRLGELLESRVVDKLDKCFLGNNVDQASFAQVMDKAIDYGSLPRTIIDSGYKQAYQINSNKKLISLTDYPMCSMTEEEFKHMIVIPQNLPDEETKDMARKIIEKHNQGHTLLVTYKKNEATKLIELENLESEIAKKEQDLRRVILSNERRERLRQELFALQAQKNELQNSVIELAQKIKDQRVAMKPLFQTFFGCLGYAESLTSAEDTSSYEMYQEYINEGLAVGNKPDGVLYYKDHPADFFAHLLAFRGRTIPQEKIIENIYLKTQSGYGRTTYGEVSMDRAKEIAATITDRKYATLMQPEEWDVLGVYQFSPNNPSIDFYSNIYPCIAQWNDDFKNNESCQIKNTRVGHFNALTSPAQSFNIYCGVLKFNQQFDSMINSDNYNRAALFNRKDSLTLKDPEQRCVSLIGKGGDRMYSHFGPMANNLPQFQNMKTVIKCAYNSLNL